jgi:succinyl-diaminopimelate desuccinylase
MDKLENLIDNMKDDIVKSTQELIKIRSVEDEAKPGMPFGEGVNQALEYTLKLGESLGLKAENIDGYAGHIEYGEGEEIIAVLVHLDVVPEGNNWTYPPYGGEIHDGKIYGRGAIDNKSPAVACIYGLKAIKDAGLKLNRRIRIILGTDEESGWKGIEYYFKKVKEKPICGFSPDAEYPIINREKGILVFKMVKDLTDKNQGNIIVKSIKGGDRPNVVPDYCEAVLEIKSDENIFEKIFEEHKKQEGVKMELEKKGQKYIIKSYGKSAHGSLPHKGKNAITQLFGFLSKLDSIEGDVSEIIKFLSQKIDDEHDGKSLGIGLEDGVSGKLVFNLGTILLDEHRCELGINIRYPVTFTDEDVFGRLNKLLELYGIKVVDIEHKKPLFVPEDNFLVKKLQKVYKEVTGEEPYLISIGGGTYARAIDNAVAFGPLFPGQEELAHQKDEHISIDDLITNAKIYARAMYELAK